MPGKLNRRDFIKIAGAGSCALAFGSAFYPVLQDDERSSPKKTGAVSGKNSRTATYCEICFWQCAGWVYTLDGKPWKIIGNNEDPNCNGRLCTRGTGGLGTYIDEERLKTPLIRTAARGKQVFREASWDEAFDYITGKMKQLAREHGPECLALFTHGSGGNFFKDLLRAYGSDNIAAPSYAQCRGPREDAYLLTFGEGVLSPERTDIENTRCLVLIGSHLGENMHNTQVQEFSNALANGASVITVDPRFSTAASKSKYWLPIRPATDLALLLAWIHVIIEEKLFDAEYVQKYTYGFEQLQQHVKEFTPERAYPITTIQPHIIRETAREMGRHRPATIVHPGRHVTWYGDDTQRVRAGAILNALLGSWGRRGGFYNPEKVSLKEMDIPPFPKPKRTWRDAFPDLYPLASLALASGICEATLPSPFRNCNVKGWFVYGTNLPLTLPQPQQTYEAMQNLDLLVAIDIMPAEITGWADVVLPECTYLERYDDIRVSPGRKPAMALRAPAFEPKYNTRPAWWMAKQLAHRLDLDAYFPFETIEQKLEYELKSVGSSLEEMKNIGVKAFERAGPLYFNEGEKIEFSTPTGKIELYSTLLAENNFDPLPVYTAHEEPPEGFYRLLYGRAPMHTFGRTTNNPLLLDLKEENEVWINHRVAAHWEIKNGEYINLVNQDGVVSNRVRAKVTERIRHDSVYLVHGFGHRQQQMSKSYLRGADDNQLITRVKVDPIMGGTGMRVNFVTFRKEAV